MKFTAQKSDLIAAMKHVCRAVEKRSGLPILDHAKITADGDHVRIQGTNLDVENAQLIDADVSDSGGGLVAAHKLAKVLSKLPKAATEITITLDRHDMGKTTNKDGEDFHWFIDALTIGAGKIEITLESCRYCPNDYPAMSTPENSKQHASLSIECDRLADMITRTKIAMSSEETRYYLCGINLELLQGRVLRMVTTDGHRLVKCDRQISDVSSFDDCFGQSINPDECVIVPTVTVKILDAALKDARGVGNVDMLVLSTRIIITIGQRVITSKLIDGSFPDYGRVIPSGPDVMASMNRNQVSDAIDRFSALGERGTPVKITANGSVSLSFSAGNIKGKEEIENATSTGNWELGANSKYLSELTKLIQSDTIEISFYDVGSPMIIRGNNEPNDMTVLMPMRV